MFPEPKVKLETVVPRVSKERLVLVDLSVSVDLSDPRERLVLLELLVAWV